MVVLPVGCRGLAGGMGNVPRVVDHEQGAILSEPLEPAADDTAARFPAVTVSRP